MENKAINVGVKLYKKVAMPIYRNFNNETVAEQFISDLSDTFAVSVYHRVNRRDVKTYTVGYVEAEAMYADKLRGKIVRPQLGVVYE